MDLLPEQRPAAGLHLQRGGDQTNRGHAGEGILQSFVSRVLCSAGEIKQMVVMQVAGWGMLLAVFNPTIHEYCSCGCVCSVGEAQPDAVVRFLQPPLSRGAYGV